MKLEIVETLDGSLTIYLKAIDEHYHSTYGAIQESQHVFIQEGFDQCKLMEIRLLEIGFGTGLNCFLTLLESKKTSKIVNYASIEKFPVPESIWSKLNYDIIAQNEESKLFSLIHKAPWNCEHKISDQFLLQKMDLDFLKKDFIDLSAIDLVYFDAFSPEKQPELWEKEVFERLFSAMNQNGILVTYCAKGSIRRLLQSVGFLVERLPGPPGKREMLRARKWKLES